MPLITVVIPTRNRPELLVRAVQSALNQTFKDIDVIVIIDGVDAHSIKALEQIDDTRLQFIELHQSVGGSEARNTGVRRAQGEWIAFLDDDDEWLPNKLEVQLEVARKHKRPIVTSRLIARTPAKDYVWPRKLFDYQEPLSEYLFCRKNWFQGDGLIQTSTLLVPKELMLSVPFTPDLKKHQDWDWLLRANETPQTEIVFADATTTIWYTWEKRASRSANSTWQFSLEWIRSHRQLVTNSAYRGFLISQVAPYIAKEGAWQAAWHLAREISNLRPSLKEWVVLTTLFIIPQELRRKIRNKLFLKVKWVKR